MFNKKVGMLALVAGTGLMALAGCGPTTTAPAYDLTIYCPEADNEVMATIIEKFKDANPEYAELKIAVTANGGEGDIGNSLQKDYASQPDILLAADDNLRKSAEAGAILPIGKAREAAVLAQAGEAGLESVSLVTAQNPNKQAYGVPYRNDNGYVVIYDSTKISDEQIQSLEGIGEACQENGVDFMYPIEDAWYTPTFFWAAGGYFTPKVVDGKVNLESNFDTPEVAAGAQAVADIFKEYGVTSPLNENGIYSTKDTASVENAFVAGTMGGAIIWNDLANIRAQVGEERAADIKVAPLPTINIGGEDKAMKSFLGYKAVAVNTNVLNEKIGWVLEEGEEAPDITREDLAWDFVDFLTSVEMQKVLLDERGYGPAATELHDDPKVTGNEFLKALQEMEQAGNTVPQGANVTDDFWTPMQNFGALILKNAKSKNQWGDTYKTAAEAIAGMITSTTGWTTAD